ncbi:hypothetical protein KWR14_005735 [Clostridioides difficile]|nr:hypothetical protein [uncultured Clostridioides sp.]EGT5422334.1 hypothetical protein [Clostridioides difficile]MBH7487392.1 hypothetical protein [Clostridioides difficile]MBY1671763.1 hypothetical protein [Clostridioides difficile]MBY1793859.1 hypothetical protein [Clostridioides difficile]MBY1996663.1 hypothetical protein [Clostridioides difficile]
MNTKLDNRAALSKIAEKLNESDMKQILAFLAGYESGKLNSVSNYVPFHQTESKTSNQNT